MYVITFTTIYCYINIYHYFHTTRTILKLRECTMVHTDGATFPTFIAQAPGGSQPPTPRGVFSELGIFSAPKSSEKTKRGVTLLGRPRKLVNVTLLMMILSFWGVRIGLFSGANCSDFGRVLGCPRKLVKG